MPMAKTRGRARTLAPHRYPYTEARTINPAPSASTPSADHAVIARPHWRPVTA